MLWYNFNAELRTSKFISTENKNGVQIEILKKAAGITTTFFNFAIIWWVPRWLKFGKHKPKRGGLKHAVTERTKNWGQLDHNVIPAESHSCFRPSGGILLAALLCCAGISFSITSKFASISPKPLNQAWQTHMSTVFHLRWEMTMINHRGHQLI